MPDNVVIYEWFAIFVTEKPQPEQAGDVDADVLGFLRALQEGDDTI